MPAAAAGAAVGGSVLGGLIQGDAARKIAGAQADAMAQQRKDALAAANSPEEIQQLQQQIALNNQDIARKQKLVDSADPALIESGRQALQLLQGKDAAALSPLKSQQAQARKQLEDKLRAQLGPGYANTTAGIQALSNFDNAAFQSQGATQQNSLSQLLGVAQNTAANYGLQNNIANASNIGAGYGNIAGRNVSAINATSLTPFAGSQYTGQALLGGAIGSAAAAAPSMYSLFNGMPTDKKATTT